MAQASSANVPHLSAGFAIGLDGDVRGAANEDGTKVVDVLVPQSMGSTIEAQMSKETISMVMGDIQGNPLYGVQMTRKELKPKIVEVS